MAREGENMYKVNYHTGAGNFDFDGTLEDAMTKANEGACYTQEDISINDASGKEVARRGWCGTTEFLEEQNNPIRFGAFGYYADWIMW